MNRDDFLARKPQTQPLTLSTGETMTIRKLSAADVAKLNSDYVRANKNVEAIRFVMLRGVANEDGSRVFADGDAARIAEMDVDFVNEIAKAVMAFSGMAQPEDAGGERPAAA